METALALIGTAAGVVSMILAVEKRLSERRGQASSPVPSPPTNSVTEATGIPSSPPAMPPAQVFPVAPPAYSTADQAAPDRSEVRRSVHARGRFAWLTNWVGPWLWFIFQFVIVLNGLWIAIDIEGYQNTGQTPPDVLATLPRIYLLFVLYGAVVSSSFAFVHRRDGRRWLYGTYVLLDLMTALALIVARREMIFTPEGRPSLLRSMIGGVIGGAIGVIGYLAYAKRWRPSLR